MKLFPLLFVLLAFSGCASNMFTETQGMHYSGRRGTTEGADLARALAIGESGAFH